MKVVITGKNGYIGNSLKIYLEKNGTTAETVTVRGEISEDIFENSDVVVHCAAIVHSPQITDIEVYNKVNCDLTLMLAEKAKKSGVKQFVFLSTMSVYGKSEGIIKSDTPLNPITPYGKSKLSAEKKLETLADENFIVTVIRPPMVYGKGCGGNYVRLRKLAVKLPFFPDTENKRSMIYIDNLNYCILKLIENKTGGLILPKNKFDVNTAEMVRLIAGANGKKIYICKPLGKIVKLLPMNVVKKAFGTMIYENDTAYLCDYMSFEKSVELSEK
jgi:UDP-glucose 4-epimerase